MVKKKITKNKKNKLKTKILILKFILTNLKRQLVQILKSLMLKLYPLIVLLHQQPAQKLPTKNELPEDEDEAKQEAEFQLKLIEGSVSDQILKLMYSDKEYDEQGFKIFRESDIIPNKYFNKSSGKWVLGYGSKISKFREKDPNKSVEANYTRDPYSINVNLRNPTTDLYARGTEWRNYIKKEKKEDEKEGEDEEEEIQPEQV